MTTKAKTTTRKSAEKPAASEVAPASTFKTSSDAEPVSVEEFARTLTREHTKAMELAKRLS